jgi:hypothetical protein
MPCGRFGGMPMVAGIVAVAAMGIGVTTAVFPRGFKRCC